MKTPGSIRPQRLVVLLAAVGVLAACTNNSSPSHTTTSVGDTRPAPTTSGTSGTAGPPRACARITTQTLRAVLSQPVPARGTSAPGQTVCRFSDAASAEAGAQIAVYSKPYVNAHHLSPSRLATALAGSRCAASSSTRLSPHIHIGTDEVECIPLGDAIFAFSHADGVYVVEVLSAALARHTPSQAQPRFEKFVTEVAVKLGATR